MTKKLSHFSLKKNNKKNKSILSYTNHLKWNFHLNYWKWPLWKYYFVFLFSSCPLREKLQFLHVYQLSAMDYCLYLMLGCWGTMSFRISLSLCTTVQHLPQLFVLRKMLKAFGVGVAGLCLLFFFKWAWINLVGRVQISKVIPFSSQDKVGRHI